MPGFPSISLMSYSPDIRLDDVDNRAAISWLAANSATVFHSSWPLTYTSLPSYSRDRLTVCYHEAGHAVLCKLVGIGVLGASLGTSESPEIVPGGKVEIDVSTDSECDLDAIPGTMLRLLSVKFATMYLSGYQTELVLHDIDLPGCLLLQGERDYENASELLRMTYKHDLGIFYCQKLARCTLLAFWEYVEAYAHELYLRGTLSRADSDRLLSDIDPLPSEIFFVEKARFLDRCAH